MLKKRLLVQRCEKNPILKPDPNTSWEAEAVFNGCPVKKDGKIYLLYRALSSYEKIEDVTLRVSRIGVAESDDGIEFHDRRIFISPEFEWEKFGCEDPRITEIDGKYYIFYTGLSRWPPVPEGIKVSVAISEDLLDVKEKHLVTPFNAKAMALFPERINGEIWAVLTVHTDIPPAKICLASFEDESEIWSKEYWEKWYSELENHKIDLQRRPQDHIEVGAPPIKTPYGWLLIYSYIRDYFVPEKRVFGVEAVLLDLKDPKRILAKTDSPILTPGEYYERIGLVPNVVFPSGAIVENDVIYLYYGAADTTCCLAYINLHHLIKVMREKPIKPIRFRGNPIITPSSNYWESRATFNPAAIHLGGKVHILYRAQGEDGVSHIGHAISDDGFDITYRSPEPIYGPRALFEKKGCEDPRVVLIDDKVFMTYTAYDGINARVALTSISVEDFLAGRWEKWSYPRIISRYDVFDKNSCIFPEKFKGKYIIIHRMGNCIDYELRDDLNFKEPLGHRPWILPRKGMWDSVKVGIAAPPIKIKEGWILFYHGVSDDCVYRVGAVLLDPEDPFRVIARSKEPLMEPEEWYERYGQVPNVVFPCGAVLIDDTIFLYYGGADTVVGVATITVKEILQHLGIETKEFITLKGFIPGESLTLPSTIQTPDGKIIRIKEVYENLIKKRRKEFEDFVFRRVRKDSPTSKIVDEIESIMKRVEKELKEFEKDLFSANRVKNFLEEIFSYFPHKEIFSVKEEVALQILKEIPPTNLLSKLGCKLEEVPNKTQYDYRDLLALANFSEEKEWSAMILKWIERNLRPDHLEKIKIKPIVIESDFLPTVLELKEGVAICRLTGRLMVSTLKQKEEYPKLRIFLKIAKYIVELERFSEMWENFAKKKDFGTSIANSIREHWGSEVLSVHSIFENKNHRILVERMKMVSEKLRERGKKSLAEAIEDICACYHLASTLEDGTFLSCSAWTWALHGYKVKKGIPLAFLAYVERDWATRDLLLEIFKLMGLDEEELDKKIIELIRRGKEPENVIKELF